MFPLPKADPRLGSNTDIEMTFADWLALEAAVTITAESGSCIVIISGAERTGLTYFPSPKCSVIS